MTKDGNVWCLDTGNWRDTDAGFGTGWFEVQDIIGI